jgi:ABC-type antimicrobial peptide transport system permease subunit
LLALTFSTALLCSVEFIREGVVIDVEASLGEGPDLIVQKLVGGRQALVPLEWIDDVSETTGVRLVTPRVWGYSDAGDGRLLTVMGVNATEYATVFGAVGTDILAGGRFIVGNDTRRMVVGQGIVDMMAASGAAVTISVGSVLSLITYNGSLIEFVVVGIFSADSKIQSYDLILTDIGSARLVLGVDNSSCTDAAVWISYGSDLNSVAFQLDTSLSQARVLTRDAMKNNMLRTYGGRAGVAALLWACVLLTVVLLVFTASSAGSEEARREVGLLKALGFDTVDILEIRMVESVTLGALGANFGISLAIVFDFILGAPLLAGYLLGWNLVLLNGGIPLAVSSATIFMVFTAAIVPIMVATVVPSWRNAITEPDTVLRGV